MQVKQLNHCCREKAISIKYCENVSVFLLSYAAFKAHVPYYIVIYGLSG